MIVAEGAQGDRLFFIVEGRAEVTAPGSSGPAPLALVSPGELFGEIALLRQDGLRQATVTALTPLLALSLPAGVVSELGRQHPHFRAALEAAAREAQIVKFLKAAAGPFDALDATALRQLAGRLAPISAPAGSTILRQGEPGDSCFLIVDGRVEVVVEAENVERSVATLGPGSLFGEGALLTDSPRNASVRAIEPCQLLALRRSDLLAVMGEDLSVGRQLFELMSLRDRPSRGDGIEAHHRTGPEGETLTVLKDPVALRYFRLTPEGWFLWQRMDGRHTIRDLTLEYLGEFKAFAPQAIAELAVRLGAAGLLRARPPRPDLGKARTPGSWYQEWRPAVRWLEWQVALANVDGALDRLYRHGGWLLYTGPAQLILALLSLAGLLAFAGSAQRVAEAMAEFAGPALVFLLPAQAVALLSHEAAHALTTKAFGRQVPRVGVGWYWFGPVAFVDTSDMWLAGRRERIAVSLAGPYANFILGGTAALISWVAWPDAAGIVLWEFAFSSYLSVLVNLNPLLEYDGYYVLADLLDRPNLRPEALTWLGRGLASGGRDLNQGKTHWVELLYGLASLLYVGAMAWLTLVGSRWFLEGWLTLFLPSTAAVAVGWGLAAALVLLVLVRTLSDLRVSSGSADFPSPRA